MITTNLSLKLLAAAAALVGFGAIADSASASTQSCPTVQSYGYSDVKITNGNCAIAAYILKAPERPVANTNHLGFTVGGFPCRVTQDGGGPRPSRYRCQSGNLVITWAYHP